VIDDADMRGFWAVGAKGSNLWDVSQSPNASHAATRAGLPLLFISGSIDVVSTVMWLDRNIPMAYPAMFSPASNR